MGHSSRLSEGLLVLLVCSSMAAIGAVHLPVLLLVAALAAVAFAVALWRPLRDLRMREVVPALIAFGLAAYTLLQAVPLPISVLTGLAPSSADVWKRCLLASGEGELRWGSISLDPGASVVEAVKWATYGAVFFVSVSVARARGAQLGVATIFASSLLAAVLTLVHGLVGATKVFGIYKPTFEPSPWHVGPLLNPNNLAGYLNLGAMCGLGLLLMRNSIAPPWMTGLALATILGVDVTTASRGGFALLPLGVVLFVVIVAKSKLSNKDRTQSRGLQIKLLAAGSLGFGALLASLGATEETWGALRDRNLEKLAMLLWVKPMVRDFPWFGIGRGSFESVFPAYRTVPGNISFTHAENLPAQWMAEWGLPVSIAAFIGLVYAFRPGKLGVGRSSLVCGAWLGVLLVVLQNWVDLGLEVPGVAIAVGTVWGSLWGDAKRGRATTPARALPSTELARPFGWAIAAVGVPLLLIALAAFFGSHHVARDRQEIYAALQSKGPLSAAAVADVRQRVRAAIVRHPADPYFPLIGAKLAWVGRDQNPMPWLERSLERAVLNSRAHLLLAEILSETKHLGQALLELRFAAHDDDQLVDPISAMAVQLSRSADELMATVPGGPGGAVMLEALANRLNSPDECRARLKLFGEAAARDPERGGGHAGLVLELLDQISGKSVCLGCQGAAAPACEEEARRHITALALLAPGTSVADELTARLLLAQSKPDEAEALLTERCPPARNRAACFAVRVHAAMATKSEEKLERDLKDLVALSCGTASECATTCSWAGDILAERALWDRALGYYLRAAAAEPTAKAWRAVARAAGAIGQISQQAEALEKADKLVGQSQR